ncbi:hypothetical protein H072_1875 [Dactylellina haptotyla CBS 200.50]|uniref:Uncharacterized protein n=1 Tax=Dactylellina haptotyla (strain CBS 200.50) TaxID=1284197 RepID=S8AMT1_DACHA|nr:hypothetical protein H072_1875 [Dactylellina haptotyla CBS 200.50]
MHLLRLAAVFLCAYGTSALPTKQTLAERQSGSKIATSHFMLGIAGGYSASNWQEDINAAKDMGIDAFALNIAKASVDAFTPNQLALAYNTAQSLGFKMYISFDFAYYATDGSAVAEIVSYLQTYAAHPAALKHNGKSVVTTFIGDNFGSNWNSVRSQVSTPLEIIPNWQPNNVGNSAIDGAFSWVAWPNSNNNPVPGPMTTATDNAYLSALAGKTYMAPVSPWFFTHFDFSSWQKNWIFASDDLYVTRWNQILSLAPPLIQIVTWNDFGESSYIGPYNSGHSDDGSSQWANGFPHDAWRTLGKPFVTAYKTGASSPTVTDEKIVYWYRPHPKGLTCSDPLAKPNGWDYAQDKIFIATMLTSPAQLVVQSGSNGPITINVGAGIVLSSVDMAVGTQSFKIRRNNCDVISGNGGIPVAGSCQRYNFNAYVGELSPSGTCNTPPPPTTTTTTTTHAPPPPTTTPSSPSPTPTQGGVCNHGQGEGNFAGLCDFSCYFGYCPAGVCTCTSYGAPNQPPPSNGQNGVPLPGLGDGYAGLCSFACNHGYCPSTACQYA